MQVLQVEGAITIKAKLFRGLADASRLLILESLRAGPRNVSELVEATQLSQPNVSSHLACLHECGLVNREQRGRHVYYFLADPRAESLLLAGDDLLTQVGGRVYVCTRYQADGMEGGDQ